MELMGVELGMGLGMGREGVMDKEFGLEDRVRADKGGGEEGRVDMKTCGG